jgi:hypothetical protein
MLAKQALPLEPYLQSYFFFYLKNIWKRHFQLRTFYSVLHGPKINLVAFARSQPVFDKCVSGGNSGRAPSPGHSVSEISLIIHADGRQGEHFPMTWGKP